MVLRPPSPLPLSSLLPLLLLLLAFAACASRLPDQPPPLADMDEPLDLRSEPDDEAARGKLPLGMFSGLKVADARDSLAAKLGDEDPVLKVVEVVENSPAAAAGVQVDDLLLDAAVGDAGKRALTRPSEWRDVELQTAAGATVQVTLDRAGRAVRTSFVMQPRVTPPAWCSAPPPRSKRAPPASRPGPAPSSSACRAAAHGAPPACATAT
jgi:hypothetical protein